AGDGSSKAARYTRGCCRCIPRKGTSMSDERLSRLSRDPPASGTSPVANSGMNLKRAVGSGIYLTHLNFLFLLNLFEPCLLTSTHFAHPHILSQSLRTHCSRNDTIERLRHSTRTSTSG
ncbi:unnamed protein product, partial [Ectocarpus sp. 8 AP-2014]